MARRITCRPEVLRGKPVIEGTRISVDQVLGLLASGLSVEEVVADYPELTAEDVRAAIAYAQAALQNDVVLDVA